MNCVGHITRIVSAVLLQYPSADQLIDLIHPQLDRITIQPIIAAPSVATHAFCAGGASLRLGCGRTNGISHCRGARYHRPFKSPSTTESSMGGEPGRAESHPKADSRFEAPPRQRGAGNCQTSYAAAARGGSLDRRPQRGFGVIPAAINSSAEPLGPSTFRRETSTLGTHILGSSEYYNRDKGRRFRV
jgi:hypothetical protein